MIKETIDRLHSELPATVKLVAVSKFHPFDSIVEAYEAGQRIFAESRPQELSAKVAALDALRAERIAAAREKQDAGCVGAGEELEAAMMYMADVQWHFIGHLQTNKLKMVLPYVSLVQSVDSERLLQAIDDWGVRNGKVIPVLLEPHVAAEETKQGFSPQEILGLLAGVEEARRSGRAGKYDGICFRGLMGMATFTDDETVIDDDFARMQTLFDKCRESFPSLRKDFTELSIGMSDDYGIALRHFSTMVRIGSMIFGARA